MFAPLLQVILHACDAQPDPADAYAGQRQRMVEEQIAAPGRDVRDPRVLRAIGSVPRHEFVPQGYRDRAYSDRPLPIGFDQTISQPFIVAFMTEQLAPQPKHRVLEVGTGSGYQAAVLSLLVAEVYSVEIVEPLARRAAADLARLGYRNVHVRAGDGYRGWPEAAPFDSIIVTCAPNHVPAPLVAQLKEGGRMVIPVGDYGMQRLHVFEKTAGKLEERAVLPVSFVPMTGDAERVHPRP
jgi:protein-L-isoaspartate(D-aspartate) O-methyltransferase